VIGQYDVCLLYKICLSSQSGIYLTFAFLQLNSAEVNKLLSRHTCIFSFFVHLAYFGIQYLYNTTHREFNVVWKYWWCDQLSL